MIVEPRYSGCRVNRYGPDAVTSRPFSRCPAAQIRSPSPTTATAAPTAKLRGVGRASQNASAAAMNPRRTRYRASAREDQPSRAGPIRVSTGATTETLLDRRRHFGHADALEAPRRLVHFARSGMRTTSNRDTVTSLAPTGRCAADRSGRRPPPPACRRPRRCATDRYPRHHQRSVAAEGNQVGDFGRRRQSRRAIRRVDDRLGDRLLARAPQHDRRQPADLAEKRRHFAEPRRRPALVRPRGAGIDQRERAGTVSRLTSSTRVTQRRRAEIRRAASDADQLQQVQVLLDDVRGLAVCRVAVSE